MLFLRLFACHLLSADLGSLPRIGRGDIVAMTPVVQFITLHPAPLLPQEPPLPLNQGDGEGEKQSEIMSVRIPEMRIVFRKESHFSGGSDKQDPIFRFPNCLRLNSNSHLIILWRTHKEWIV